LRPCSDRIDLFVVSEPMTIVPYFYSDEYPIAHYDFNPYKFDSPAARSIFMDRLGAWVGKYHFQYENKIMLLTWQYRQKFLEMLKHIRVPRTEYVEVSFEGSPEGR
jgi:predicted RNA-binding protein